MWIGLLNVVAMYFSKLKLSTRLTNKHSIQNAKSVFESAFCISSSILLYF